MRDVDSIDRAVRVDAMVTRARGMGRIGDAAVTHLRAVRIDIIELSAKLFEPARETPGHDSFPGSNRRLHFQGVAKYETIVSASGKRWTCNRPFRLIRASRMRPSGIVKYAMPLLAFAIVGAGLYAAASRPSTPSIKSILHTLDETCLGCGYDAYADGVVPHPMAFGLLASVGAKIGDESLTRTSADWLVANASPGEGKSGWGLGFSWDAFNDKSVNPSETVYGITTAVAVAGLLDAYEATGDPLYAGSAAAALDYYKSSFTRTDKGGYFWYSEQVSDNINVHNVSSMLMGQYARASRMLNRPDFDELARHAFDQLIADMKFIGDVPYWYYSDRNERPNDAVHAAYITQGLIEYSRNAGHANLTGHDRYLASFLQDGSVREFSPLHNLPDNLAKRPARLWGVGMLIYTLTHLGDLRSASQIEKTLGAYISDETTVLSNLPNATSKGEPRMVAHVALGLAELRRSQCWIC